MKKFAILGMAALLVAAFCVPAGAFDSEFGGYWRTRIFTQKDFNGTDTGARDITQADTRSRLYYTAVFSDDFKFVNKFEWNSTWGDTVGGDIGADGMGIFRIKNSYAYFNLGQWNFMIGVQPRVLARGFLFDDDFAGFVATYKCDTWSLPLIWIKAYEGGMGNDANDWDVDYYGLKPTFNIGDNMKLTPFFLYIYSKDARNWGATTFNDKLSAWYLGADLDVSMDSMSMWASAVYESVDADTIFGQSIDIQAYLFAIGGDMPMGPLSLHGQFFYASGDDNPADNDAEAFFVPRGQSYYWSEIMGNGVFDNQASSGSPAAGISNIMAFNVGMDYKVSDAMKLTADLWYAKLAEDNAAGNDSLGTEIDLKLTYGLMDNLKLELIGAYLFADDATFGGANQEDPMEIGTRISLSF